MSDNRRAALCWFFFAMLMRDLFEIESVIVVVCIVAAFALGMYFMMKEEN